MTVKKWSMYVYADMHYVDDEREGAYKQLS